MGHIRRLTPIAKRLSLLGHKMVFVLRSTDESDYLKKHLPDCFILKAPIWVKSAETAKEDKRFIASYADVLYRCGYKCEKDLSTLIRSWRKIFEILKPSVVVCDHSPTVVLAARGVVPVVHIGSGFATPPVGKSLPNFSGPDAGAPEREEQVLASINAVLASRDDGPVYCTSDIFASASNFTCCLPELDPYDGLRTSKAIGPVISLPRPEPMSSAEGFIFGYLSGFDDRVPNILRSIVASRVPALVYLRNTPHSLGRVISGSRVKILSTPQDLPEVLKKASAIIHHGGLSTAEIALGIGRTQFLIPRQVEQDLTTRAIEKLGCGYSLARQSDPAGIIRETMKISAYNQKPTNIATIISERANTGAEERIVRKCFSLLDNQS